MVLWFYDPTMRISILIPLEWKDDTGWFHSWLCPQQLLSMHNSCSISKTQFHYPWNEPLAFKVVVMLQWRWEMLIWAIKRYTNIKNFIHGEISHQIVDLLLGNLFVNSFNIIEYRYILEWCAFVLVSSMSLLFPPHSPIVGLHKLLEILKQQP